MKAHICVNIHAHTHTMKYMQGLWKWFYLTGMCMYVYVLCVSRESCEPKLSTDWGSVLIIRCGMTGLLMLFC